MVSALLSKPVKGSFLQSSHIMHSVDHYSQGKLSDCGKRSKTCFGSICPCYTQVRYFVPFGHNWISVSEIGQLIFAQMIIVYQRINFELTWINNSIWSEQSSMVVLKLLTRSMCPWAYAQSSASDRFSFLVSELHSQHSRLLETDRMLTTEIYSI